MRAGRLVIHTATIHRETQKIVAIVTGHTHRSSVVFAGNLCQYVSNAASNGAAGIFEIRATLHDG
ncbi:MAG: hypothetical protein PHI28_02165 [Mangrovibacterium sp.]|nr:hypothetical protein [Mangrovibacterium sp.]